MSNTWFNEPNPYTHNPPITQPGRGIKYPATTPPRNRRAPKPGFSDKIHSVEKIAEENIEQEKFVKKRGKNQVSLVWKQVNRKKFIAENGQISVTLLRLEKNAWQAFLKIGNDLIVACGLCRQTALWTAWDSARAELARNELGLPHKLDWGDL